MYALHVVSVQPPLPSGLKAPVAVSQWATRSVKASPGVPLKLMPCTKRKDGVADAAAPNAAGSETAEKEGAAPP